jgi:putative phosphoserine phosphatase/1-acylglycerol-3-phosphate O-acyltransferase
VNDDLTAEIEDGPKGPEIGAFFDFDGTLIHGYSAAAVYEDRLRRREVPPWELVQSLLAGLDMAVRGSDVSALMRIAAGAWAGRDEEELEELGERLFAERIAGSVYPEARALVAAHHRMGHTVVMASSATPYQVNPLADDLGIEYRLCTRFEVEDGRLTGRIAGPVLWGEGKAEAVAAFAAEHGIDLPESYAYANGDEDVPFLERVGRPRPLNPGGGLTRVAAARGWPVRRFEARGRRPGPMAVVRTAAALGGVTSTLGVAVGVGILNRSRRAASNLLSSVGPEVALGLAGVSLRVSGEEHLWSHRPAVFIFNHQSALDVFILADLLRRDFTGVVKREASRDPLFAPLGYLADVAYVERDRGRKADARAALASALDRLREGVSVAVAPEGTRSATRRVGPFKKGAFHLAIQAGVPVVPIVIRNAGDLMWRRSLVVRSGTVDVFVRPPIDVTGWNPDELDAPVAEVRQLYVDALADWPG